MTHKPIFLDEFSKVLDKIAFFENNPHIAVSVSGGPDSMALMCLLNQWVKFKSGKLTALIVDHQIRKKSKDECVNVKKFAESREINCDILTWGETKPKSRLMELARKKRYELLIDQCKRKKILHLMVGHHLDDKLETFYMRSLRKGNIVGLSSMPWIREIGNLRIIRPFLNFSKKRLIQTCKYFDYQWFDDPSNKDERYERVKIRNKVKEFSGNKVNELVKKNSYYIKKRGIYEGKISTFFVNHLKFDLFGRFFFNRSAFDEISKDIKIEVIKRILVTNSGNEYPPKKKPIEIVLKAISANISFKLTLNSNIIKLQKGMISFTRESHMTKKIMKEGICVKPGQTVLWDNRFKVSSKKNKIFCSLISLENWNFIKKRFFNCEKRKICFEIIKTLPLIKLSETYLIPFISPPFELKQNGIDFRFSPKRPITSNKFLIIN